MVQGHALHHLLWEESMSAGTKFDQLIGSLMQKYRSSALHSQRMGSFLARMLALLVRFRRSTVTVKEINGVNFELDLNQSIDSSLFFSGTFEEREEKVIQGALSPGMVAMDIGANFGYHTFQMARLVSPQGRVYALEPTAWAYDKMVRNAGLNPDLKNITFLKVGLSDVDAGMQKATFQSSYRLDGKQAEQAEEISIARLDTVVRQNDISRLDLIKMDVDGYEGKVIRGALQTLSTLKPILLMEITPDALRNQGDDLDEVISTLLSLGYCFKTTREMPIDDLAATCKKIPKNTSIMVVARVGLQLGGPTAPPKED